MDKDIFTLPFTVNMAVYTTREEWLKERRSCIGGSDAAAVIGMCPWKTSADLYDEKIGVVVPKDISDNPLVKYGNEAEPLLRELFELDYPQYNLLYMPYNMWTNEDYPFAHASLDGWLYDAENDKRGILEIKTATISSAAQKEKWRGNNIPQHYYAQILHYLMVTGFDFAILKAQLKYEIEGEEPFTHTKHYRIERAEVEQDIAFLVEKEQQFWEAIKKGERPPIALPDI